jgi:hypothetical protein
LHRDFFGPSVDTDSAIREDTRRHVYRTEHPALPHGFVLLVALSLPDLHTGFLAPITSTLSLPNIRE